MKNAVKSRLQSVQLGEPQTYKDIAIVPLVAPADAISQYRTLGETHAPCRQLLTDASPRNDPRHGMLFRALRAPTPLHPYRRPQFLQGERPHNGSMPRH